MQKISLHSAASRDIDRATARYDSERPGCGQEFLDAVQAAVRQIQEGVVPLTPVPPSAGAPDAKRVILKRFPYDVVVRKTPDGIRVVAVSHHAQKPGYWRHR